jgi:GNAT superfamily N-acetyltransferase
VTDAVIVRAADESEVEALAKIWYCGWRDAHAQIVPAELTRLRTLESFTNRMRTSLSTFRVASVVGMPVGFHVVKNDELHQFYVAANSRGTGVAAILIADAETRLRDAGIRTAWLACAIGNERAARFYEKRGWHRTGIVVSPTVTTEGILPLEVWRYEKSLA